MTTPRETVILKTPHGHDVLAELEYDAFAVRRAKVVHNFTGVTKPLKGPIVDDLARALRAKQVYEHALSETRTIEQTLDGFGSLAATLGVDHPALEPYWRDVDKHRAIADDMRERARYFHDHAMQAIDKLADDER